LIDSNQDWKAKWFYVTNHHPELPKPAGSSPSTGHGGTRSRRCKAKIKALREVGLRAEHVAFSFMKRRV
jgi:hypothetical protein